MDPDQLRHYLDDPRQADRWLQQLNLSNADRAHHNLLQLAELGITLDLLAQLAAQFEEILPQLADPDMALNNLERFLTACRNPLSTAALFERDLSALPTLMQIFSTSQYLSDQLAADPESYDLLRLTEGQPVTQELVKDDLTAETATLDSEAAVLKAIRRFKRRETLRIAYGDIVVGHKLETVTEQISFLADAIVEAAYRFARSQLEQRWGKPLTVNGAPARFVVLALGKLGGIELNYSSDIDLVFLFSDDGRTDGHRHTTNREFFERLAANIVGLLSEVTDLGPAYRVDTRLRPQGRQGPLALSGEEMLRYYDVSGRTWERQAYIKARPVAGAIELGASFLSDLEPWIYRRYLSLADITGIKALKRRIESRARTEERDRSRNLKTGWGGIRDIEFVIQFLQLVNGGSLPQLRIGNTLEAIHRLHDAGCLELDERNHLEENYRILRLAEHRLQILFDLQTHTLPTQENEQHKLALRLGYRNTPHRSAREAFEADLEARCQVNRKILDHLLHDAFGEDTATEPVVDLINDPDPSPEQIKKALSEYPFEDVDAAYRHLMALATEPIRFLSTRRCRHFFAAIAPRVLQAISKTPDPDFTLLELVKVSDSLGGKRVLWELFSASPPSLELYVRMCATCPYVTGILTSNPGMIDGLMDSLLLEGLPRLENLERTLGDLCYAAEDLEPILHSFKDSQHLRVAVRDILGKDDIQATHAALSDIAEACLKRIVVTEHAKLVERHGEPTIEAGDPQEPHPRAGEPCSAIVLALGKLGGREPNYHSDLDIVFLYEADGRTVAPRPNMQAEETTNQHFFSQLGQRIIQIANRLGPYGRLYEVDPRLRPTGRSGSLAVSLSEFRRYFREGDAELWECQALTKGRVVYGTQQARADTLAAIRAAAYERTQGNDDHHQIADMRQRLEETASRQNLKRGPGGTVDIEFVTQMLQLRHGRDHPSVQVTGTLEALTALRDAALLSEERYRSLSYGYRFLRRVEAGIRLMNLAGRHEMPEDEHELRKLAFLLGAADAASLCDETRQVRTTIRQLFDEMMA